MKCIANPVQVEAHKIVSTSNPDNNGMNLALENGQNVHATVEMLARMMPVPGDYWVIQADGYIYLNPKEVFERKYRPLPESQEFTKHNNGFLERIKDDEPMFVLRAQDKLAHHFVRQWAAVAKSKGLSEERYSESMRCADAMELYPVKKLPD